MSSINTIIGLTSIPDETNEVSTTNNLISDVVSLDQQDCDTCSLAASNDDDHDDDDDDDDDDMATCDSNEGNKLLDDREPILHLLDLCFPNLSEVSSRWSPESYWYRMKEYTKIDLDLVMEIYKNYQNEDNNNSKMELRRKFVDLFIPAICQLN